MPHNVRSGRRFDKDGNAKQWWTDKDVEHFKEKARCMVDQYNAYHIPEVGMNVSRYAVVFLWSFISCLLLLENLSMP